MASQGALHSVSDCISSLIRRAIFDDAKEIYINSDLFCGSFCIRDTGIGISCSELSKIATRLSTNCQSSHKETINEQIIVSLLKISEKVSIESAWRSSAFKFILIYCQRGCKQFIEPTLEFTGTKIIVEGLFYKTYKQYRMVIPEYYYSRRQAIALCLIKPSVSIHISDRSIGKILKWDLNCTGVGSALSLISGCPPTDLIPINADFENIKMCAFINIHLQNQDLRYIYINHQFITCKFLYETLDTLLMKSRNRTSKHKNKYFMYVLYIEYPNQDLTCRYDSIINTGFNLLIHNFLMIQKCISKWEEKETVFTPIENSSKLNIGSINKTKSALHAYSIEKKCIENTLLPNIPQYFPQVDDIFSSHNLKHVILLFKQWLRFKRSYSYSTLRLLKNKKNADLQNLTFRKPHFVRKRKLPLKLFNSFQRKWYREYIQKTTYNCFSDSKITIYRLIRYHTTFFKQFQFHIYDKLKRKEKNNDYSIQTIKFTTYAIMTDFIRFYNNAYNDKQFGRRNIRNQIFLHFIEGRNQKESHVFNNAGIMMRESVYENKKIQSNENLIRSRRLIVQNAPLKEKFSFVERNIFVPKGSSPMLFMNLDLRNVVTGFNDTKNVYEKLKYHKAHKWVNNSEMNQLVIDLKKVNPKKTLQLSEKITSWTLGKDIFQRLRVIGQVDNKYIICKLEIMTSQLHTEDNLILLDQHAIDERANLEELSLRFADKSKNNQLTSHLLSDYWITLTLSNKDIYMLLHFSDYFLKFAFRLLHLSSQTLTVSCIPEFLHWLAFEKTSSSTIYYQFIHDSVKIIIEEQLVTIQNSGSSTNTIPLLLHQYLCKVSCMSAVKFGDKLSVDKCKQMIHNMTRCTLPFMCAHGRPVIGILGKLPLEAETEPRPTLKTLRSSRTSS